MSKNVTQVSDVMRDVRKKSVIARVNPSVALARTWKAYGVELTTEQIIQIQLVDKLVKPQTIVREWGRQNKRATEHDDAQPRPVGGLHEKTPLLNMIEPSVPKRRKVFGIF